MARASRPIGLAQLAFEDIAGILARQAVGEVDLARNLVAGQDLAQRGAQGVFAPAGGATSARP